MREAFKTLLKDWGKNEGLLFIPEYEHKTAMVERRYIDGALVEPQLRLPVGYWEAKDTNDDLDAEIAKKFRRGYPQDNIIFEDSETAVLFQNKREVLRCSVDDPEKIKRLVDQFFKFEPEVIREFRKAVEQFREDLPAVLETLRKAIDKAENENTAFKKAAIKFLKHAKDTINTSVTAADVREMLIQHILTEEIFSQVFDNTDFHHNNNVAKELYNLEATFFTGGVKRETIERLRPYYSAITPTLDRSDPSLFERRVAQIVDHSFNNSQLFSLAKWVLILSLAVLGVGSLSYGGLSLKLWSQAGEATQKLQEISDKHEQINHEIEQKQEALVEAQDETIREVKRVIEEKARGWDNELSSLVDKSKQEVLEKLATANTFIEDQKSKVLTSVAGGDAFIESQKGKIVRDISDVSIVIEGQKGKISSDLVTAIDYFEAEKKGFAKILNTASTSLEEQKRKFATDLALLLEETNGKVDPAVKERLLVVAKAAENGAQTIEDESRRKVEVIGRKADTEAASIHQAAEGKKSDLDLASERDIRSIGAALNVKLNDLNQRSRDAGLSIDTIVGSLAARESSFVSAMNSRLTAWDQRVGLELMRVDDLTKVSAGLDTKIKEMNDQLAALLPSFKPALEVAEELKSGTKSGELPFIGKVLEKSAALFFVGLVISVILVLIGIAISLSQRDRGLRQGS